MDVTVTKLHQLSVNGEVKASVANTKMLSISASVDLEDVTQQGSHISGVLALKLDTPIGSGEADIPWDIDTTVGNPIVIDFGYISLPVIGDVDVSGEFSYDIPGRQVCVALTLAGVVTVAKTCTNF
jgi:hypothetical protein